VSHLFRYRDVFRKANNKDVLGINVGLLGQQQFCCGLVAKLRRQVQRRPAALDGSLD
jgi:hypothetical protein